MQVINYVAHCTLSRSTFPDECYFTIRQADGTDYVGIAPVGYCYNDNLAPLPEGTLPAAEPIPGLLSVRVLANGGPTSRISLPTGDTITVTVEVLLPVTENRSLERVPQ